MDKNIYRILGVILILIGSGVVILSLINFVLYVFNTPDVSHLSLFLAKIIVIFLLPFFLGVFLAVFGIYTILFNSIGSIMNALFKSTIPAYMQLTPVIEKQSEAAAKGFRKGFKGKV